MIKKNHNFVGYRDAARTTSAKWALPLALYFGLSVSTAFPATLYWDGSGTAWGNATS
jgi:hypothetical protein